MQEETERRVPSLTKLGKLANRKEFGQLEDLWLQAVVYPDHDRDQLLAIAGQVGRLGDVERADRLARVVLEHAESELGSEMAMHVVRTAARQIPGAKGLREELRRLYNDTAPDFAELPGLLDLLCGEGADLKQASDQIDVYLQIQPGAYVVDYNWVVPGIVEEINADNGVISVRFEDRRNEYGPSTLNKIAPRSEDFFPALVLYAPDRLVTLAEEDPPAFVKLALEADLENRLSYKDLKKTVTRLLGEKGWQSWWKGAREQLKRDPLLGMSAGSQPVFRLLRQADQYEDRLRRRYDRAPSLVDKLRRTLEYLDETGRSGDQYTADEELLVHMGNGAAKIAVASLKEDPVRALAALAVHGAVAGRGAPVARPNPQAAAQVLASVPDTALIATELPDALVQPTLDYIREMLPDRWPAVWSQVMLRAGRRLCDHLGRGLVEAGQVEALHRVLLVALEKPTASPELVCWLWRSLAGNGKVARALSGDEALTPYRVVTALLTMTDGVGNLFAVSGEDRHQKVLESGRTDLMVSKGEPLLAVIREADSVAAGRLKDLLVQNQGLNPALRSRLKYVVRAEHPELFQEMARPWEDETVLYSTEDGLRRREHELKHIVEEEIPEVARQIGEAASFGDLSENAEWTAAIEKRDQLASRANTMENELKLAKVINHELAGSSHANIGTRVTARDPVSGEETVYTFLGPWDSDPERHILFYGAPLAQAFMGKKPGETAKYGEGQWEIIKVEPAV